jgi:predicted DNA binding CopG/RHH family protein
METIKKKKRETITIYLEKEDKEYLVKKAKASGITANAYIREELFKEKRPNMQMQGTVQVDELLDGSIERNHSVTTYLSEKEYQYVKKNAGGLSVASFIRKLLLAPSSKKTENQYNN